MLRYISCRIVIETLSAVDGERKCFRMVGGVLVERTVSDVLGGLRATCEQLPRAVRALEEQLSRKGDEINEYIRSHDIRVQRLDRTPPAPPAASASNTVLVPTA